MTNDKCSLYFGDLCDRQMKELKLRREKYICRTVGKWSCASYKCCQEGLHNVDIHGMLYQTAGCIIDNSWFLRWVVTVLRAGVSSSASYALVTRQLKEKAR